MENYDVTYDNNKLTIYSKEKKYNVNIKIS